MRRLLIILIAMLLSLGSGAVGGMSASAKKPAASASPKGSKSNTSKKSSKSNKSSKSDKSSSSKKSSSKSSTAKTSKTVKQEQQQTQSAIKRTDAEIKATHQKLVNALHDLDLLDAEIAQSQANLSDIKARMRIIGVSACVLKSMIQVYDARLDALMQVYRQALVKSRRSRVDMSDLAFVFASESFEQAFRRVHTLRQFAKWRETKAQEITLVKESAQKVSTRIDALQAELQVQAANYEREHALLVDKQAKTKAIVKELQGHESDLKAVLKEQQRKAEELDKELDRIIKEEERKAREAEERRRKEEERKAREAEERRRKDEEARRRQGGASQGGSTTTTSPTTPSTPAATTPATTPTVVGENRQLSSDFKANKGRLPYPVDRPFAIVKHFGTNVNPNMPLVTTQCSGIDIETKSGAPVKCIFDGTVSAIVCPDGVNNAVMVRCGNYVCVYSNMDKLEVRTGDAIKAGQRIGTLYIDTADGNRSILHFEIRNATNISNVTKEDPEQWLK